MSDIIFNFLEIFEEILWSYVGFTMICAAGIYLTFKTGGYQFKSLFKIRYNIKDLINESREGDKTGINPFKLFFASVGGMVGLGNVTGIVTAVIIGGPGSILWMWVASIFGMLLKYSEIYLGVKYRIRNNSGGYDGGPMFYLREAFSSKAIPIIFCILLCVYGVEIFQFVVLTDQIESTLEINRYVIIISLMAMIFYTVFGGIRRLSNICSILMPPFMLGYIILCFYIIFSNYDILPEVLATIFKSAFTGHAAIGGFAGSSFLMAAYMGTSKAVYSGDIGIGYDSIVQSETRIVQPKKQAQLAIYALFTDTLICTLSTMIVTITGAWHKYADLQPSEIVNIVLTSYVPYTNYFMTILFFLAAFTTITAFLTVGIKCARFISQKYGKVIYISYAIFAFIFFSFFDQTQVMVIMSVAGGLLMILNITAILRLKKKIEF